MASGVIVAIVDSAVIWHGSVCTLLHCVLGQCGWDMPLATSWLVLGIVHHWVEMQCMLYHTTAPIPHSGVHLQAADRHASSIVC